MTNNLQRFIESSLGVSLVSALGHLLPVPVGYWLADRLALQVASRKDSPLVRAVRANQWVVRGERLGKVALDQAAAETFQHMARSIFDLYHYTRNPEVARRMIVMDPATQRLFPRPELDGRGLIIVGLHISNFDMVLQTLCQMVPALMVLTIPSPQGGRRVEYEIRRQAKMNLLPASVDTFRRALSHLQQGGIVLTGIDRPTPESKVCPHFFGRPAMLPTHHIFLAAKAQVPVMIIFTNLEPDGKHHIYTSELIEMDSYPDREKGMLLNAEKVLSMSEDFIRRAPSQWSITLPVWPETLDLVPG